MFSFTFRLDVFSNKTLSTFDKNVSSSGELVFDVDYEDGGFGGCGMPELLLTGKLFLLNI